MSWKQEATGYVWTGEQRARFEVNMQHPLLGLSGKLVGDGNAVQLFQVSDIRPSGLEQANWSEAEWLARQNNLSMDLPYSNDRPTGIECYWRFDTQDSEDGVGANGGMTIESWVSANTRLLDEVIACQITSQCPATQVQLIQVDSDGTIESIQDVAEGTHQFSTEVSTRNNQVDQENALLCCLPDSDYHLLLAGFPGDQLQRSVQFEAGKLTVQSELNFGFLEKGVIRRARLFAAFLPSNAPLSTQAEQRLQTFYHSPLPLMV